MTDEGIKKCFAVLNGAYINFYKNMSVEDWTLMKETWSIQFAKYDDLVVFNALQVCISKEEFPPSIAAIKKSMLPDDDENEEELWERMLAAGRNGNYGAREEWDALPSALKAITTPATIREIANADDETLHFIKKDIMTAYKLHKEGQKMKALASAFGLLENTEPAELPYYTIDDE